MKCTVCGKFAHYLDPEKVPRISVVTPDSEFTKEDIEIICWQCQQEEPTNHTGGGTDEPDKNTVP